MVLDQISRNMASLSETWLSPRSALEERKAANQKLSVLALTPDQTYYLHIASVAAASLSLVAGMMTTYWFFRMRRSYRHDLIMLLIGFDMFQAIWFFTFPAVELVHGPISSTSKFCEASGFFLTLSIIVSDVAIMLITIHTALYIFRGEQGLYPFRKYAYVALACYPIIMASLAFVNKAGYVNTGQFCYLPIDPVWVRLVLSWAPRYVTFATILFCSAAIYVYVKILMRRFGDIKNAEAEQPSIGSAFSAPARLQLPSTPPTPTINSHGLFPSGPSSRRNSADDPFREHSVSTMSTLRPDSSPKKTYTSKLSRKSYHSTRRYSQAWMDNTLPPYFRHQSSEPDLRSMAGAHELATLAEVHIPDSTQSPLFARAYLDPNDPDAGFWNRPLTDSAEPRSRTPSLPNIFTMLGRGPDNDSAASDTWILAQTQPRLDATGLVKTRETIRRQVKHVFIYPVVYVAVWTLPFIVHLTNYGKGVPFGVRMASVCCLCLHGCIDAAIFSWKEKPWLHTRRLGHRISLSCWKRTSQYDGMNTNAGRTREEMMTDGRLARQRRDRELADRQQDSRGRKGAAEWWDSDV
ncbi:G protein-coupled glucose receptor regulating Gpa2-domain-containing protein [Thelonectria olida]|uniref:G protein-coupled glucose receptor regulating Gpa2-domain-containing protein n=1 Tax=Thelonectria olida TaxID=1576542 RepID=A0A9P8WBM4_9HYPO|nr:G protein-coupled glucose receptor regulating Gpa2-domain-containing protein [Thelonectria olida]